MRVFHQLNFQIFGALLLALTGVGLIAAESRFKSDETVVFFPSVGSTNAQGQVEAVVRGWIFEPERRPGAVTLFRKCLGWDQQALSAEEQGRFLARVRLFLVDAESRKKAVLHCGTNELTLRRSDPDGQWNQTLTFPSASLRVPGKLHYEAVLSARDHRKFGGEIFILSANGISVVSDIDDTIKITDVRNKTNLLRNTFAREFRPVPGLAAVYQGWATNAGTAFHYVSGSPVQLYPPLRDFADTNGFPAGSWHLRTFAWREELRHPEKNTTRHHKLKEIGDLLRHFPQRQFVLVGDTGEADPEIYGELARAFPRQVRQIYLRDVTGDGADRYEKAFEGCPRSRWRLFQEAKELPVVPIRR